jgi:hypothetical protein
MHAALGTAVGDVHGLLHGLADQRRSRRRRLSTIGVEAMIGMADVLAQSGRRDEARQQLAQIDSAMQLSPRLPAPLARQLQGVRANLRDRVQSGRADE